MDSTLLRAKYRELYHYYDYRNQVHIGIHYKNYLKNKSIYRSPPLPFFEFNGNDKEVIENPIGQLYVKVGYQAYPLIEGLPIPDYNDDFGKREYNLNANIVEKIKLHFYEKMYYRFNFSQGLTKSEILKAIETKNNLQSSRMKKVKSLSLDGKTDGMNR